MLVIPIYRVSYHIRQYWCKYWQMIHLINRWCKLMISINVVWYWKYIFSYGFFKNIFLYFLSYNNTQYIIHIQNMFINSLLLVRLIVNSRILLLKFWRNQKLYGFLTVWEVCLVMNGKARNTDSTEGDILVT